MWVSQVEPRPFARLALDGEEKEEHGADEGGRAGEYGRPNDGEGKQSMTLEAFVAISEICPARETSDEESSRTYHSTVPIDHA